LVSRLDEVINLLNKQIELDLKSKQKADLPKAYLSAIIVHLANNDVVAAGKAYDSYLSYVHFNNNIIPLTYFLLCAIAEPRGSLNPRNV